jgi:signal transduction histidine kinase
MVEKKDGQASVSIKDTGSGINPEIKPKLFSKFVTNSSGGTGIGLFISKSIVEAHDGSIRVRIMPMERVLHLSLAYH